MKKLLALAVLLITVILVQYTTQDTKAETPCEYVLDLGAEQCCAIGGNCCGPFGCE